MATNSERIEQSSLVRPLVTYAAVLTNGLEALLSRLRLSALRHQLDNLLEEALRKGLKRREALTWLSQPEVERKDQRCNAMAMGLAKFP